MKMGITIDDGGLFMQLENAIPLLENQYLHAAFDFGHLKIQKIRKYTPRDTGEAQASIGIYDPSLLRAGATADPANAVFIVRRVGRYGYEVIVGSNLRRLVPLNYGWTVTKSQRVAITDEGGRTRWVTMKAGTTHPGYFMFEKGAAEAAQQVKDILSLHVQTAFKWAFATPGGAKRVRTVKPNFIVLPTGSRSQIPGKRIRI